MHTYLGDSAISAAAGDDLQFDSSGVLAVPAGGSFNFTNIDPGNGAAPLALEFDVTETTQFSGSYVIGALSQDGYSTGRITGIDIDGAGVVFARYSNGQSSALGQVALTKFSNPQGLRQLGDSSFGQTFASGDPLRGVSNTGSFGEIQSGALESSNVNLTEELVNMITAQRNFQANAQMIQTEDQITQTVINIR